MLLVVARQMPLGGRGIEDRRIERYLPPASEILRIIFYRARTRTESGKACVVRESTPFSARGAPGRLVHKCGPVSRAARTALTPRAVTGLLRVSQRPERFSELGGRAHTIVTLLAQAR
jgi:hypothetical protein